MRRHWRHILFLVALAFVALPTAGAGAAPGSELWLHLAHPDAGTTVPAHRQVSVALAPTGDVYVAGSQQSGAGERDFLVARYSSAGVFKWSRVYDRYASQTATDVAADRLGNVVVCGYQGDDAGFLVVKYSRAGVRLWTRRLTSTTGLEAAREVAIDGKGAIYVAGSHSTSALFGTDLCLVKYSASGRTLWTRTYRKADDASQLAIGPDGKLYVGGGAHDSLAGDQVCVARYRPDGTRDWVRVTGYPRGADDWITDLSVRRSGIAVTGYGMYGGFVLRLKTDGTTRYLRPIPEGEGGTAYVSCGIDDLGRVTAAGWWGEQYSVRRFGSDGAQINEYEMLDIHGDAYAVAVSGTGEVYVTGSIDDPATGPDFWTVGITPAWQPLFTPFSYGSPTNGDDEAHDVVLGAGCFYVGGSSDGDLLLAKYER